MRKKTEARRNQILKAATKLFLTKGYEKTSMDELTAKLGYSKATIYNYFPSKKDLFGHAINEVINLNTQKVFSIFTQLKDKQDQIWQSLYTFGINYLKLQLSTEVLGISRITIYESKKASFADILNQYNALKEWHDVADYFQLAMENQILRSADPMQAAMHFKGLLEGDLLDKSLRHIIKKVSTEDIERVVASAVDIFKRAYQA